MRNQMLDFVLNECIELRERLLKEFASNGDKVTNLSISIQPDGGSFTVQTISYEQDGKPKVYLDSLVHEEIEIQIPNTRKSKEVNV